MQNANYNAKIESVEIIHTTHTTHHHITGHRPERNSIMKKSSVYKVNGESFRYNYDERLVEHVYKATEDMLEDNKEWMEKFNKPLWNIDESGYTVMSCAGLRLENWRNKEARREYLEQWASELKEEAECLAADYIKYEYRA